MNENKCSYRTNIVQTGQSVEVVPGLDKVRALLEKTLRSGLPSLQKALSYSRQSPGKMIRPALVILSSLLFLENRAKPVFRESDVVIEVAAAAELIHSASLIHDDIIDNASIRRGIPAVHTIFGKTPAVRIGNFYLAKAFYLLQKNKNTNILILMNRVVSIMCQGESDQLDRCFDYNLSEKEYQLQNFKKTSILLAACCEAGALSAGIEDEKQLGHLRSFGKYLGYAFQIIDDVLDFIAHPRDLGKPVINDFRQGTVTLPLIYMLRKKYYRKFISLIDNSSDMPSIRNIIRKMVIKSGALEYSLGEADRAIATALENLNIFAPSIYKDYLRLILKKIPERANAFKLSGQGGE